MELFQPKQDDIPRFSIRDASKFAKLYFGLAGEAKPLPSYYDQNFLLITPDGSFVIKIANASRYVDQIHFENTVLQYLASTNLHVPKVKESVNGTSYERVYDSNNKLFILRILLYIPGTTVSNNDFIPTKLLIDIGTNAAKLDSELMKIEEVAPRLNSLWELGNAFSSLEWVDYLPTVESQKHAYDLLGIFKQSLQQNSDNLRKSLIHGYLNPANLLIKNIASDEISGIIDFGELKYSCRIFYLAIACMYVGLRRENPLEEFSDVILGYNLVIPLTDIELKVLFPSICARVCVSTIISHKNSSQDLENKYILTKCKPNLELLRAVAEIEPNYAYFFFKEKLKQSKAT